MDKIIEAVHLKKNYGGFTAVDDITFHVNRGEFFGFLGPNGAGKMNTLSSYQRPGRQQHAL